MTINSDKRAASITALAKLLDEIAATPSRVAANGEIRLALRTQGSLSYYRNDDRGVIPQSLNTLKRVCKEHFPGGYSSFDLKRRRALDALEHASVDTPPDDNRTKAGMLQRIDRLQSKNQLLNEELSLMTYLLDRSMSDGLNYATRSDSQIILDLCRKEQRALLDMMSLRRIPRQDSR